ncbi:MAG: dTDP-4-dehydrorhamnose reductase [Calditrichaeota bacterium]|nr:MAG: dTDP-4-dehydrorhamnose reductase [Calditrichota bacterium]
MHKVKANVLVTGAHGLLGYNLIKQLKNKFDVFALDLFIKKELCLQGVKYIKADITNQKEMTALIKSHHPRYIFNAAAYTNVDGAETEKELCWKINVEGVARLAHAARLSGSRLIHVSTDYIFDGNSGPYSEDIKPDPLGYYGKSKLAGENELTTSGANWAIGRTMVLYGFAPGARLNFVTWIVEQLRNKNKIRIVDDQIGNPTLASDLASALIKLAVSSINDVFHLSGSEIIDRYHFAKMVADVYQLDPNLIERIKTADLGQAANRPLNSGFLLKKAKKELGIQMLDARSGIEQLKSEIENKHE